MCLIPKAVHMMVDANAANGDGVVRCGEVRRSEKVVRRKKEKKEKKKKEKRERKKGSKKKKISFCCQFWSNVFNTQQSKNKYAIKFF